jgi:hypothetical protein
LLLVDGLNVLGLGLPWKVHDRPWILGHDLPVSSFRLAFLSNQLQDSPSEFLGGALRVYIREVDKQGRGAIATDHPIRQCLAVQAIFAHAFDKPAIRPPALQPQDQVHSSRL